MSFQDHSHNEVRRPGEEPAPADNLLLAAMPERSRLAPLLERVSIPQDETIYERGTTITHYVFPLRGVTSIVKEMDGGTVEIGTVGREGMIGVSALLGARVATSRVFAQSDMLVDRIAVDDLEAIIASSPGTQRLLWKYVHAFHEEVSLTVACNRLHSLEQRLARWLLMSHDRLGDSILPLKQRFLAYMLGVRRPAVSLAAGALQEAGAIRYSRGKIAILDRGALESATCECYHAGRRAYQTLGGRTSRSG
jgi:CRP-like cAMP-binding protein